MNKSKIRNILPNRRLIDSKWVFKKKIDGWFRSRLVAQGYNQIQGLNFTINYSPAVTDARLRITLTYVVNKHVGLPEYRLQNNIFICSTIVENLHKDTRRNVGSTWITLYIRVYSDVNWVYLRYCTPRMFLVQGYTKTMTLKAGFNQLKNYTCIPYRVNELRNVFVTVYVDGTLEIGDKPSLMNMIQCNKK